jgi:transcriptional regulator with XRE-family HTH domain
MMKRGLPLSQLAANAILSKRTIKRLTKGRRGTLKTFGKLANALGVTDCTSLYYSADAVHTEAPNIAYRLIIVINEDGERAPIDVADQFIRHNAPLLGGQSFLMVEKVDTGSVVLHARGNDLAAEGMIYLFCIGHLHLAGVQRLSILGTVDIPLMRPIVLAREYLKTDGPSTYSPYDPSAPRFGSIPADLPPFNPGVTVLHVTDTLSVKVRVYTARRLSCKYVTKAMSLLSTDTTR